MSKRFRVAFSYAGDEREFVSAVAAILADRFGRERILYDEYHQAEFARSDLAIHLPVLYRDQSDLVVVVLSGEYEKEWRGLEWNAIYALIKQRRMTDVMLCRFGRVETKGLLGLAGYLDLDDMQPGELATLILQRLALNEGEPKSRYTKPADSGGFSPTEARTAPHTRPARQSKPRTRRSKPSQPTSKSRRFFICYRREDSSAIVGRIYDRLVRDFGVANIFKDVDNVPFGVDFVEHLDREVQKCDVLLAIIGPHWGELSEKGVSRLDDENDFVRIEIASALRRSIPVVPVLVDGALMPRADKLPDEVKGLARRNGTEVRHDPDFHGDMTRLFSRLP